MNGEHPAYNPRETEDNRWYKTAAWRLVRKNATYQFIIGATLFFSAIAATAVLMQWYTPAQTLSETRAEFKAAQRAYVNFGSKTGILAEFDPKATVGGKPIIILHFTNGGLSTARHLAIQVHTGADTKPFSFTHRHRFRGPLGELSQGGGAGEADLAAQAERIMYIASAQFLWSPEELKTTNSSKRLSRLRVSSRTVTSSEFTTAKLLPLNICLKSIKSAHGLFSPAAALSPDTKRLGGPVPVEYKEIEPCEQPNEPESFEFRPIATPTATP